MGNGVHALVPDDGSDMAVASPGSVVVEDSVVVEEDVQRAREILRAAERILDDGVTYSKFANGDPKAADAALGAAQRAVSECIQLAVQSSKDSSVRQLAEVLLQSGLARVSLMEAMLARRTARMFGVEQALCQLRGTASLSALEERAPVEAHRLGFTRILFSRIDKGVWIARAAYTAGEEQLARTLVQVGVANPRPLTGALVESEMARRRVPILVRNPQSSPRVHAELVAVVNTKGYVAAPVISWGKVVGLLHADRQMELGGVDEFDRDLLGMFAEGLGVAFERNVLFRRLRSMRSMFNEHVCAVNDLVDDIAEDAMEIGEDSEKSAPRSQGPYSREISATYSGDAFFANLTPRECDVLRSLASGKTNAQIASILFVTEGTVKSHVKHILRKIGAANRTDAVARYHALAKPPGVHRAKDPFRS